jgi:hypothetical protein
MEIKTLIDEFNTWTDNTVNSVVNFGKRSWCLLGFSGDSIKQADVQEYFERKDLNDEYIDKYTQKDIATKQPYSYVQAEINMIYSFQKSFNERHKTRIQTYRDDCAQKKYFLASAIALGYGKFLADKSRAEKQR